MKNVTKSPVSIPVATVLTVYGIETSRVFHYLSDVRVATVLTVYGIETDVIRSDVVVLVEVATVLTVYDIETYTSHG